MIYKFQCGMTEVDDDNWPISIAHCS